jgi:hypothetical protein
MSDMICSADEFKVLVERLVALPVALPWKGYGSAIHLELGQLSQVTGNGRPDSRGEACIAVEWDWRVEHHGAVLYGSSNRRYAIAQGIEGLRGARVEHVSISGTVPELAVAFSNGQCLRSMVMVTGNPQWAIKLQEDRWIHAREGRLEVGQGERRTTEEAMQVFAVAKNTAERWGRPVAQTPRGHCSLCAGFVPLDGEGHLLDYGVCIARESPFDGKVVRVTSGCPVYVAAGKS